MGAMIEILNANALGSDGPVSMRLRGGRIDWFGPAAELPAVAGDARRIDGTGRWLLPGLCDSHLHLFSGGVTLDQLNLLGLTCAEDMARALAAYRKGREGAPLLGAWAANYEILGPGTRPDRHALDRMVPDQPLLVLAVDLHTAWANTAALQAAGLMDQIPDVADAEIVPGTDGKPNGELREGNAMGLVMRLSDTGGREGICLAGDEPQGVTPDQRSADKAALRRALEACAAYGITTAINMDGNLYQADLLTEMAQAGDLPIHVSLPMRLTAAHSDARVAELIAAALRPPVGRLSFGRIKLFMDGVFDTWTAYRTDEYPGRPGFRSQPLFQPNGLPTSAAKPMLWACRFKPIASAMRRCAPRWMVIRRRRMPMAGAMRDTGSNISTCCIPMICSGLSIWG